MSGLRGALIRYTVAAMSTIAKKIARYRYSQNTDGALYSKRGLGTKLLGPWPPAGPGVGLCTAGASGFGCRESAFQNVRFESAFV